MKKRIMATAMALIMSAVMLTGCSSTSKSAYQNDVDEFIGMSEDANDMSPDDYDEMADALDNLMKDLKVKTPEGKNIKSDFEDMVEQLEDFLDAMEDGDLEVLMDAANEIEEITKNIEEHIDDFLKAAEDAGVDVDDLEDLRDMFDF